MLEDAPCKLSRPENVFATDLSISRSNGIPFIGTGIKFIEFVGAHGQWNECEADMVENRWKLFTFWVYTSNLKKWVTRQEICPKCFLDLVMLREDSQGTLN